MINSKKWSGLAASIDGDGSICIGYKEDTYQLTCFVYSSFRPFVKELVKVFGGQFRKLPTEGNRKQKYCWYTTSHPQAKTVLQNILPFLIMKQRQAEIGLEFLSLGSKHNPESRYHLMKAIQDQNHYFEPVSKKSISVTIEPSKDDYSYLANMFDAEGSFSIQKRGTLGNGQYTSYSRISNTDDRLFQWIRSRFPGRFSITNKENRDEGTWTLSGKHREQILLAIIPYTFIKRKRAVLLLEWIRHNRKMSIDEKQKIYFRLKGMNRKGLPPEANTSSGSNEPKIESDLYGDMQYVPLVITVT